jgi:diguanylate cyclase (GGDEF)-like protein
MDASRRARKCLALVPMRADSGRLPRNRAGMGMAARKHIAGMGACMLALWVGVAGAQPQPPMGPPPPGHAPPGAHPPPPPPPPPGFPPPRWPPPDHPPPIAQQPREPEAPAPTLITALPPPEQSAPTQVDASFAAVGAQIAQPATTAASMPAPPSLPVATPPSAGTTASQAAADPASNAVAAAVADPEAGPPAWPWILALSLALLAWWAASRRSQRLAQEARQLTRQQRQLKSAHEQLRQQSAHLRNLSIHDPLTGALNRQAFAAELRELIDHLARFGRPLNLIVFDLDHFKQINDQCGHLAGDAALKLVVGIAREHLVSADLLGRFGGDEFLIACADQSLASCAVLADAIRDAVERKAPEHTPALPGLTLSMGVAEANPDAGYDPDELFARADAALYEAKRQGRNRVVTRDAVAPGVSAPGHRHL